MTPHWILGRRHRMWRTLCLQRLQRLWRPRRRWWRSQTTTHCRDKLKAQSELRLTKVSGQVVHSIFRVWRFFSSIPKFRWLGVLRAAIRVRFHVVRSFTVELKQKKLTQRFQNGTASPVNCLLGCWFQRSWSPACPPAHLGSWSKMFKIFQGGWNQQPVVPCLPKKCTQRRGNAWDMTKKCVSNLEAVCALVSFDLSCWSWVCSIPTLSSQFAVPRKKRQTL